MCKTMDELYYFNNAMVVEEENCNNEMVSLNLMSAFASTLIGDL